jgi:hypothetical protein
MEGHFSSGGKDVSENLGIVPIIIFIVPIFHHWVRTLGLDSK